MSKGPASNQMVPSSYQEYCFDTHGFEVAFRLNSRHTFVVASQVVRTSFKEVSTSSQEVASTSLWGVAYSSSLEVPYSSSQEVAYSSLQEVAQSLEEVRSSLEVYPSLKWDNPYEFPCQSHCRLELYGYAALFHHECHVRQHYGLLHVSSDIFLPHNIEIIKMTTPTTIPMMVTAVAF